MQAKFKISTVIDGEKFFIHQNGDPKTYSVSPKIARHPHFKLHVKHGNIVIDGSEKEEVGQETIADRNEKIHQIVSKKVGLQKVESDPEELEEEIPVDSEEEESLDEGDEEMGEDFSEDDESFDEADSEGEEAQDVDSEVADDAPKKQPVKRKKKKSGKRK